MWPNLLLRDAERERRCSPCRHGATAPELRDGPDAFSLYPTWYPDGTKLLFYACDADCGLYRIRTGGDGFRPWGLQRGVSGFEPDFRDVIPG